MTPVHFVAGTTSHGGDQAAQVNRARFEQNGADVTSQVVVNPSAVRFLSGPRTIPRALVVARAKLASGEPTH